MRCQQAVVCQVATLDWAPVLSPTCTSVLKISQCAPQRDCTHCTVGVTVAGQTRKTQRSRTRCSHSVDWTRNRRLAAGAAFQLQTGLPISLKEQLPRGKASCGVCCSLSRAAASASRVVEPPSSTQCTTGSAKAHATVSLQSFHFRTYRVRVSVYIFAASCRDAAHLRTMCTQCALVFMHRCSWLLMPPLPCFGQ